MLLPFKLIFYGFCAARKIRVPWCFISNSGPTGWEPPLDWDNLAPVPRSQFHTTSGKSCVPKSSSCKKDFLHLCCANNESCVYEGKHMFLIFISNISDQQMDDSITHGIPSDFAPLSCFGEGNSVPTQHFLYESAVELSLHSRACCLHSTFFLQLPWGWCLRF